MILLNWQDRVYKHFIYPPELIIGVFDYFIYGQFTGDFIQATIASIIVSVIAMVIHLIFGMKK